MRNPLRSLALGAALLLAVTSCASLEPPPENLQVGEGFLIHAEWTIDEPEINAPRISGYVVAGLMVGPGTFGLLDTQMLDDARLLFNIALGLILFELGSRLDSLQDAFLERLEAIEVNNRRTYEALARAIDRAAAGRDPRAAESLGRPPQRKAQPAKPAAQAAKPTAQRKPARRRAGPKSGEQ